MRIIWTEVAKLCLLDIFTYYKEVAGLKVANQIKVKIFSKTKNLKHTPEVGQIETNKLVAALNYRYIVSGNYKIIYKVLRDEKTILILTVFDTRQNPEKMDVNEL
jgi:toxin ParE1/3/4